MPKGKCRFNSSLMSEEEFKLWLKPGKTVYNAKCSLCDKEFSVCYGLRSALSSHKNSKEHKIKLKSMKESSRSLAPLFFKKVPTLTEPLSQESATSRASQPTLPQQTQTQPSTSQSSSQPSTSQPSTDLVDKLVSQNVATTKAEIIWVLRMVKNHNSFRSCLGLSEDLKSMFGSENGIVENFSLSKTKSAYLVKYGIAPWVKQRIADQIAESPFFSISFDESLNKKLQKNQMDIQIRFWSDLSNKTETRYWGSEFQYKADAITLKNQLLKSLEMLPLGKHTQLAMDGPNVNWKILELLSVYRDEEELPSLENIGSCGLHVISGALHTGVLASGWPIEELLRALFKFIQHSPARRSDYLKVSEAGLWPKKFVVTRWVENESVSDRAIAIWNDYVKLIDFFTSKVPSKQPKSNKSYEVLKQHRNNSLIIVYLNLFRDVAARLNNFLVKFQTDAPMVPFLSDEISSILRWLMSFFINSEVLKKASSSYLLSKVDVKESGKNWVLQSQIKLTISGNETLKKVSSSLHSGLIKSWVKFLEAMVLKIQEKSPICYKLVRVSCALDPIRMASENTDNVTKLFDGIVSVMYSHKRIDAKRSESAKEQFSDFLRKVVRPNRSEFLLFDMKINRLDEFLGFYVNKVIYKDFWYICLFIFTLSHGQSAVERGFNINNEAMFDNLEESSLTSIRSVYDEILQYGSLKSFPINNSLLISCKSACSKYKQVLQEKRDNTKDEAVNSKRKLLCNDLVVMKKKKVDTDKLIAELNTDADDLLSKANETDDLNEMKKLVSEANAFKKLSKEKRKLIDEYDSTIEKMEEEISSLSRKDKKNKK